MIKLNSNYLDRSYADIKLSGDVYNYNSYNINATSDYYSYFYNNLFSYNKETGIYKIKDGSKEKFGFDYSYLALHDSVLLNDIALNNKCTIYKRFVKSTGLGYISWKNWFSQLYLQNEKLLDILNKNKLTKTQTTFSSDDINLLASLSPDQQSFSYNYLSKELNLSEDTIDKVLDISYSLNGYDSKDKFKEYSKNNSQEPFILNYQAIQNLKGYNVDTDENLEGVDENTSESGYKLKKNYTSLQQTLYATGIKMNIKSSFASTAHTDLFEGRSLISRDLFLDDTIDAKGDLSNFNSNYMDLNVSKFVDIILTNSNFSLGMNLNLEKSGNAVKELVKEIKDDTTGAIKGIGKIFRGLVKLMPGGKLVGAINNAVATLAGISQGISSSSQALSSLSSISGDVKNTLTSFLENGVKIAKSGKKSVGLTSQAENLANIFNKGSQLGGGISDIIGGITQVLHSGTAMFEEGKELAGADNDVGQTSVKYVNWNNLTQVVKSETAIQFYEDTLSFTFSLGQFGIFNTIEEVIKPCLNLLALVEPSKIDFNKMFGPYFTVESLIMKSGLGDNISSFARSFLKGDTQIESNIFMKDFWDISIGPGIHFYNCMFYKLNITFSDEKDQNGLPIKANCTLSFRSQTPKSILSNYTSQVSFRFGSDINLIDLYNSIPNTIKEFDNDGWKNSTLTNDLNVMKNRNTLLLTEKGGSVSQSGEYKEDVEETIKYMLGFYGANDKEISLNYFNDTMGYILNMLGENDITNYFYAWGSTTKNNHTPSKIIFNINSLLEYAKSYASINGISYSNYANEEITLALIYPVRKISNKGNTILINNTKFLNSNTRYNSFCDGELIFVPKNNKEEYIKNILKTYNKNDAFFGYGWGTSENSIESFFALSKYLNPSFGNTISKNELTFSVLRYKRELNNYKKLDTDKNENNYDKSTKNYLFDDDELEVNDYGYSGFYIKKLLDKNDSHIFLSDIFIMNDFLLLKNSVKSSNLNYVAGLNVTQDKNIFYNKNRENNVKLEFDNEGRIKDNLFFGNDNNYLKRTKIADSYVLSTKRCTRTENVYGSYTYGFKLSPYNSNFLDMYGESETKTENTNTTNSSTENADNTDSTENKEDENKETSEKENKESSINTSAESESKSIDVTSFVNSNLLYGSDKTTFSYLSLQSYGLANILVAKNIDNNSFLDIYKNEMLKLQVASAIQSFRNQNNIPIDEGDNKYTFKLEILDNTRITFSWTTNASYVENSNEG